MRENKQVELRRKVEIQRFILVLYLPVLYVLA